jgi:hypothetical protein
LGEMPAQEFVVGEPQKLNSNTWFECQKYKFLSTQNSFPLDTL